jgi:hypothetical protein
MRNKKRQEVMTHEDRQSNRIAHLDHRKEYQQQVRSVRLAPNLDRLYNCEFQDFSGGTVGC